MATSVQPPEPSASHPAGGHQGPDPSGQLTSFLVLSVCQMPLLMLAAAERHGWRAQADRAQVRTRPDWRPAQLPEGGAGPAPRSSRPAALRGAQSAPQRPVQGGMRPARATPQTWLLHFSFVFLSVLPKNRAAKQTCVFRARRVPMVTKRGAQCHRVPLCCSKSSTQAQVPITVCSTAQAPITQYPSDKIHQGQAEGESR